MLMMNESQLRPISIGYVAENKLRDSLDVEIILAEVTPFVDGEVVSGVTTLSVDGVSPYGDAQSFTIQVANTIRAEWKGDGTNRVSPPDVRRGEKVKIYQYSNVDKFYWEPITQPGINTRKRETVIEAFSNTTDESQTKLDSSNSWYKEFSTHDKRISIVTNKSDGEKWAYTIQVDVAAGNVVVADDKGTFMQMNSDEEHIELGTASGGLISLLKKILTIDVDEYIVNAKKGEFNIADSTWTGNSTYTTGQYTFNANAAFTQGITHKDKSIGIDHLHTNVRSGTENSGPVK